ncbi:acyl-CoA ligase (AMP-forming), exosortase A system-associated [Jatrophihabitans sp. DSM 44399]|uniref:Acyl-CoA ligase (AMP-forming), exosortase A system-associated n=1 Tax=Jatrophihabitans lederbergiae TaxID=3075547 RepID=A0ABU2JAE0_9ACTN|nr:acyl-CoA ligase (AMP-forming), exosortase A system-associated [Jatrophihabitans sp. DSM 44399]MDT0261961.1 acyl-CoA ligase (AMP-forming), exosortase A system-associated [Jatrophihabitans sp. DSM 44399]
MTMNAHRPLIRLDELLLCGREDRPALTYQDETLSYQQLRDQVAGVAAGLRDLGIRRGDRVLVYLEKRIETVVAMLAVSAADGVLVPANPVSKPAQVAYVAADCGARFVVTTTDRYAVLASELAASARPEHLILVAGTAAADPGPGRWRCTSWAALRGTGTAPVSASAIDTDLAAIFYTSGSTGGPKGVVLSHRNLLAGAESVASYLEHTGDDVVLGALPLSFDAGFSQLTTSLFAGAHLVLVNYLLPREIVRLCARHQVTALTCVPPLWLQLAAQTWPAESTASLRYFANTGGRMPRTTLDQLRSIFPAAKPYLMYGLTEAFRSTYLDPAQVDARPDSIGKAIPNADVLVLRPDGTQCESGEHGEIVHRGALVALEYWNAPDLTAQRFRPIPRPGAGLLTENAVWSGDVAYRDDEGFLYFVGRTDDLIKTSGYRVSPAEIEEVAYASGLVNEAVAFGVPDDRLGQHIVLVVAGECDVDILRKTLQHELPRYLVPQRIVLLTQLPRSGNGKFDRVALRGQLTEGVPG